MKKGLLYSIGVVLYYLFIVYIFNQQIYIFPVFTISAFFFSMFLNKKEMIFSFSLLFIVWVIHLFLPNGKIGNIFIYLIFTPLTFWLGYFLKNKYWIYKILYPIVLIFIGVYGFLNANYYVVNFNAHKDFKSPTMAFYTDDHSKKRLDTLMNKIIVLDFWTTSCGVCFSAFPNYEKLFLEFKDDPLVNIYSINIPIKRDTVGFAKKRIEKYKYQFPVLYADSDSIPKELDFNTYPHLVIIKNGRVRFNGYPTMGKNLFINDLKDEIDLLLNE